MRKIDTSKIKILYGENDFRFELLRKDENEKIPEVMMKEEYVTEVIKKHTFKRLSRRHIEAWRMFHIEGVDPSGIAKHFKRSCALILNKYNKGGYLAIFDTEIAGYAAEYAVRDLYYPNLKVYGGNEEQDLCDDIKNPTIMVEVKKRDEHKVSNVEMLSTEELEFVTKGGEVHLVIVVIGNPKTLVECYKVLQNKNEITI